MKRLYLLLICLTLIALPCFAVNEYFVDARSRDDTADTVTFLWDTDGDLSYDDPFLYPLIQVCNDDDLGGGGSDDIWANVTGTAVASSTTAVNVVIHAGKCHEWDLSTPVPSISVIVVAGQTANIWVYATVRQ